MELSTSAPLFLFPDLSCPDRLRRPTPRRASLPTSLSLIGSVAAVPPAEPPRCSQGHALVFRTVPSRHYPRLWIRPPSSGGRRDFNPPDQCAAWRTLWPPRTPAAPRPLSPSAYADRVAPTRAAQTGLSCSVPLRVRVLRPIPRRDLPHVRRLSRLQASLHVAARGLAPSEEAFDTPLGPRPSPAAPGVCYSALRRLPRRDLHPLEKNSVTRAVSRPHRHDAPCMASSL